MMTHLKMFSLLPSNMIISGQFNLNTGVRMISEDGGLPLVIILSSTEGQNQFDSQVAILRCYFLFVCLIIF